MRILSDEMTIAKILARKSLIFKSEKELEKIQWWQIFKKLEIGRKIERYRREISKIENN